MRTHRNTFYLTAFLFVLLAGQSSALANSRSQHRVGIYAESPIRAATGVNLGVNVSDWVRVHAGTSVASKPLRASGATLGAMYFFSQNNLSPFIGGTFNKVGASNQTAGLSTGWLSLDLGGDWEADIGFNLGVRVIIPVSAVNHLGAVLYVGWYF